MCVRVRMDGGLESYLFDDTTRVRVDLSVWLLIEVINQNANR